MQERIPDVFELARILKQHEVITAWLTSSLFNAIIDEAPETLSGLKQVLIGGEALSLRHVRRALSLLPGTTIVNGYGPTSAWEPVRRACRADFPEFGGPSSATWPAPSRRTTRGGPVLAPPFLGAANSSVSSLMRFLMSA